MRWSSNSVNTIRPSDRSRATSLCNPWIDSESGSVSTSRLVHTVEIWQNLPTDLDKCTCGRETTRDALLVRETDHGWQYVGGHCLRSRRQLTESTGNARYCHCANVGGKNREGVSIIFQRIAIRT